MMTFIIY